MQMNKVVLFDYYPYSIKYFLNVFMFRMFRVGALVQKNLFAHSSKKYVKIFDFYYQLTDY